jgi:hypothetical protein
LTKQPYYPDKVLLDCAFKGDKNNIEVATVAPKKKDAVNTLT